MATTKELSTIKVALEYAQFRDYRIREGVLNLISSLDEDLIDVGYESSENTKEVIEALKSTISEFETKGAEPEPEDNGVVEDEDITVEEEEEEEEKDDSNVDEDIESFIRETVADDNE